MWWHFSKYAVPWVLTFVSLCDEGHQISSCRIFLSLVVLTRALNWVAFKERLSGGGWAGLPLCWEMTAVWKTIHMSPLDDVDSMTSPLLPSSQGCRSFLESPTTLRWELKTVLKAIQMPPIDVASSSNITKVWIISAKSLFSQPTILCWEMTVVWKAIQMLTLLPWRRLFFLRSSHICHGNSATSNCILLHMEWCVVSPLYVIMRRVIKSSIWHPPLLISTS